MLIFFLNTLYIGKILDMIIKKLNTSVKKSLQMD